ncbi:MAG: glycerol-3-phosphate 1-O-acyltransferase PlsY [Alphaproteobacteria bacterium]|nr:glycerol-3-phosphate 1-O-acyltransferase PlsY [Alphaproteobacteria bacterium]
MFSNQAFSIGSISWAYATAAILAGYLLGSIPFGLIFSRLSGAGDVRKLGSGNIGATNVLRTGKRWAAAATLICDAGKGAAAVLIAGIYGPGSAVIAGVFAFFGHVFPVWLRFRGGKGVATFLGVALALDWRVGALTAATWLAVAAVWRISSLSALVAAAVTPLYFALLVDRFFVLPALALALLIMVTHRPNIRRLMRGEESRMGAKGRTGHEISF